MILTGSEIGRMREKGLVTIEPFVRAHLNPNSYNYRLGHRLGIPSFRDGDKITFDFIDIPADGYVLVPATLHLGHTLEELGSSAFAMSLIGRSSLGRLGLFLQVSANLGHTGSSHQWTLELVSALPLRIYPGMRIGQISFWRNRGKAELYRQGYTNFNEPQVSLLEN